MAYQIDIQYKSAVLEEAREPLETAIGATLLHEGISNASLTLLLTDDKHMRQLNQGFRGLNKTTDVLSFPSGDPVVGATNEFPYLGDIAISKPTASRQAAVSGHPLVAELQLLAVHGVLHLLGYDHLLPDEKQQMWSAQFEILDSLGLQDISLTDS